MNSWLTDKNALRAMPFEELEQRLAPLINKFAHKASPTLPGHDLADIEQEIRLVIWKCQTSFDPTMYVGFGGKQSKFINFTIHAIMNRLNKLQQSTNKYYHPVTQLECTACRVRVPAQGRTTCACGNRTWLPIRDATIMPVEALVQDVPGDSGVSSTDEDDFWAQARGMPEDVLEIVHRFLHDEKISLRERKTLQAQSPRFESYRRN